MKSAKVPSRVKSGYAVAEIGIAAIEFFIQVYLLKFYADVVGLAPAHVGLVLAVAMVWEAVTDPVIGAMSDGTRSRWGKRRPYLVLGAPLLAVAFVAMFFPPGLENDWAKAGFLLGSYLIVNTAMTLVAVPHTALGGDLSDDPDERTSIFGWRFLFANLGLLVAIVVPALFSTQEGGGRTIRATPWIGGLLLVGVLICVGTIGTRDQPAKRTRFAWRLFAKSLVEVVKSKTFLPLLIAYIVGSMGRTLNASIALFYYEIRLGFLEAQVFLYILLPFSLMIAGSIWFWTKVAQRQGKKPPAFWGIFLLGLMTCIVYPLLQPGQMWMVVVVGLVGGFLVGAVFLLDTAVTDVVDIDEWQSGQHREGLYFGVWRFGSKVSRALGLALSGWLLGLVGFDGQQAAQDEIVGAGLAWLFGPGVGLFFVAAALILLVVPLSREGSARVQAALRARRQSHR